MYFYIYKIVLYYLSLFLLQLSFCLHNLFYLTCVYYLFWVYDPSDAKFSLKDCYRPQLFTKYV